MNYKKLLNNQIIIDDLSLIYKHHSNKKNFFNKTLMITGNNGFIGTYLSLYFIHYFKKLSIKKIIFIDTSNSTNLKNKDLIFLKQDVTKSKKIIYKYKPDIIIHAATFASPVAYRKKPIETAMANVEGLKIILEYAKQKKTKILFFSTSEIYGNPDKKNIPTSENYNGNVSCVGPRACYDESKRFCETLVYIYSKKFKLNINVVRPFNNFGPGLRLSDGRLPSDMASSAINNKKFVIYSDGKPTRTFCYIADAIIGYINTLNLKGFNIINIGNPNNEVSVLKFTKIFSKCVKKIYKSDLKIQFKKNKDQNYLTHSPKRRCPNINLAKKMINYKPRISLEGGIIKYLKYIRSIN